MNPLASPRSFLITISFALLTLFSQVGAKPWKSAELGTTQQFKYGAFEARIRTVQGSGQISTFFLWKYGSEVPGAQWQEQDFEMWGKNGLVQTQAMTPGAPENGNRTEHVQVHTLPTKSWERYYTYRMEWTPSRLRYLINGTVVREETDTAVYRKLLNPTLAEPMQLRTGLWAGNYSWPGLFDSSFVPQAHFVNWIQVYSFTPGQGPNGSDFTLLWRDDFNSIDWSRWTPSNWTFDVSITDYIPGNNLIRNGVLTQVMTSERATATYGAAPEDDNLTPPLVTPIDTTPITIPATIAAERLSAAFDSTPGNQGDRSCLSRNKDVDFGVNTDTIGGTCQIGWISAGEWIEFDIKTDTLFDADVFVRMAAQSQERLYHLEYDGSNVTGPIGVINTGWNSYHEQRVQRLLIQPGRHKLRIVFETGSVNFSSLRILKHTEELPRQTVFELPARLMATDYSNYADATPGNLGGACSLDGVDKALSTDVGGGCYVGWTAAGEWLEYQVSSTADAQYDLGLRAATAYGTHLIQVSVDGQSLAKVSVPNNGWSVFTDIQGPRLLLTAGIHTVRLTFVNGSTNLRSLDFQPTTQVPPTPIRDLTAAAGDAKVTLNWTPSLVATAYKVLRNGDSIANPTSNSYLDQTVTNGLEYRYQIVATNDYGASNPSNTAIATPIAPIPPPAPTGLLSSSGDGTVLLSWTPSTGAESYRIYRSTDAISYTVVGNATSTQYTDASVSNGTLYSYRVTAIRGNLESNPSVPADARPRGVQPATVTGLLAIAGDQKVTLSWTSSSTATSYQVFRSTAGSAPSQIAQTTSPNYLDEALINGTPYSYSVVATNDWGSAAPCSSVEATPVLPTPASPSSLVAIPNDGSVSLTWTAGMNNASFAIYRALGLDPATKIGTSTTPNFTDNTVVNGTTYSYSVTGVNGALESSPSSSVTATPKGSVPSAATSLVATSGNAMVSLTWAASTGATSYKVMRQSGSGPATQVGSTTATNYQDATVSNGSTYSYTVVASNPWGDASASNSASATPDFPAPGIPSALAASAGDGKVALTWTPGTDNASFNVYRAMGTGLATRIGTTTTANFTDATVVNGNTYTYTVSGVNGTKESAVSASVAATPKGSAPAAATGLVATAGNALVSLAWTGSSGATLYKVLRSDNGQAAIEVGTSTSSSFQDATVSNGTSYSYAVIASNQWGDAVPSTSATAIPDFPAPGVPTDLAANSGDAKVSLTWTAGTNCTSFNIYRATGSGASTKLANSVSASFTDATVVNGTTYTYTVTGVNGTKESPSSASVVAKPVATVAKLKAQYKAGSVGASINGIRPLLQVVNTGTVSIPLSQVTVRYWFTKDGAQAQNYWCDWAQVGTGNVVGTFKAVSPSRTNADGYLEISFKTAAGNLAAGASTGEIQSRFSKSDWSNYTQTNDASYDATKASAYADWSKVTVYVNGSLVWGVEP